MGRRKVGETPVYSYRIRKEVASELIKIQQEIQEDWNTVFEQLVEQWRKISVLQKKYDAGYRPDNSSAASSKTKEG